MNQKKIKCTCVKFNIIKRSLKRSDIPVIIPIRINRRIALS